MTRFLAWVVGVTVLVCAVALAIWWGKREAVREAMFNARMARLDSTALHLRVTVRQRDTIYVGTVREFRETVSSTLAPGREQIPRGEVETIARKCEESLTACDSAKAARDRLLSIKDSAIRAWEHHKAPGAPRLRAYVDVLRDLNDGSFNARAAAELRIAGPFSAIGELGVYRRTDRYEPGLLVGGRFTF